MEKRWSKWQPHRLLPQYNQAFSTRTWNGMFFLSSNAQIHVVLFFYYYFQCRTVKNKNGSNEMVVKMPFDAHTRARVHWLCITVFFPSSKWKKRNIILLCFLSLFKNKQLLKQQAVEMPSFSENLFKRKWIKKMYNKEVVLRCPYAKGESAKHNFN